MPHIQMDKIIVSRTGAPLLAFPDLSLEYRQRVLLRGPSGSGKTTLLCVMMGLLKPSAGSVRIAGQDLYKMPLRDRDPLRGRTFGYVFQTLHLLPSLTITQNIALAAEMAQLPIDEQRLKYLINVLGLTDKAHRFPGALSQGEQQRAAIARAVLNKPPVIIADEPTSALDDDNTHIVMELLRAQAQETGATLVIATHDSRISAGFDSVIHLGHSAGRGV